MITLNHATRNVHSKCIKIPWWDVCRETCALFIELACKWRSVLIDELQLRNSDLPWLHASFNLVVSGETFIYHSTHVRFYVCMYIWLSTGHVYLWLDLQYEYKIEQIVTDRNINESDPLVKVANIKFHINIYINPSNAEATFVWSKRTQRFLKTI